MGMTGEILRNESAGGLMKVSVQAMLLALAVFAASTWAAPKKIVVPANAPTIQKALDEAEEGDTVYVNNGT
jgi:hypothetical protein